MILTSTISPSLKTGLRFLGVWPDTPYANVNRLIYMSSILIMQYFQYLFVLAHCKADALQDLVDSLPLTVDYSLTTLKLMTLWKHRRMFHDMLIAMDTDWRECVNIDRYLQAMTMKASISHFCSNAMLGFYTTAGILYFLGDFAITIVAEDDNDTSRPLPIKILFPFETERSPIYEILVVVLFLHPILNTYTTAILNSLIFSLVLHTSGQIDIICQGFKTILKEIPHYGSSKCTIGMLIERHRRVISFSKNLDKLFSFMALMQVFFNTLVMCCLGLLVVTVSIVVFIRKHGDRYCNSVGFSDRLTKQSVHNKTGANLMKTGFAYGAVTMEIFIFCFAGEYLSLKSKLLADAAYDSLWYNMPPNQSKNMSLVILRSQQLLTITVGRMTNLSLEVFANIMKTSASYVSVLHAMY